MLAIPFWNQHGKEKVTETPRLPETAQSSSGVSSANFYVPVYAVMWSREIKQKRIKKKKFFAKKNRKADGPRLQSTEVKLGC